MTREELLDRTLRNHPWLLREVVEAFGVKLEPAGTKLRGFSPFRKEKTPSFFIDEKERTWHDFASGQHGDAADFVRAMVRH